MRSTRTTERRAAALLLAVLALLTVSGDATPWDRPDRGPVVPRTSAVYGSGIAADGLANTQVGGTSCGCPNLLSSYRFRAGRSTELAAIRIYLITDKGGYSGGTGGAIQVTVQADDGSPWHRPSERVLASAEVPLDPFPHVEFLEPATLKAGHLYHVVFRNTDPEPTRNFVSIDSLYVAPPISPRQAQYSDTDWAQLMDVGEGWSIRPEYTPILQLEYADGSVGGIGYMESWVEAAETISGVARVRETFVVSGGDVPVSEVSVRLGRTAGSGPLIVRLETAQGELVSEVSAPGTTIPFMSEDAPSSPSWVTLRLPVPRTLHNFHAYNLVLSSHTDTTYVIHGIRKGEAYGFESPTYFADGFAQVDDGNGWVAFDPGWRGPLEQADLQFYLR